MNITITGHHVELTDALKDFVNNKFSKIKNHFNNITQIHITLTIEHNIQIAEADIHLPNHPLHARAESHSMYAAIDLLIDKCTTLLRKHKEKMCNHQE